MLQQNFSVDLTRSAGSPTNVQRASAQLSQTHSEIPSGAGVGSSRGHLFIEEEVVTVDQLPPTCIKSAHTMIEGFLRSVYHQCWQLRESKAPYLPAPPIQGGHIVDSVSAVHKLLDLRPQPAPIIKVKILPRLDGYVFSATGNLYPCRGVGPLWYQNSCSIDCVIVAARLLNMGRTVQDMGSVTSANEWFQKLPPLVKAFQKLIAREWESSAQNDISEEVRENFLTMFQKQYSIVRKRSEFLAVTQIWAAATNGMLQLQFTTRRDAYCAQCKMTSYGQIRTHCDITLAKMDDALERKIGKRPTMSKLLNEHFHKQSGNCADCKTTHRRESWLSVVKDLPPRLVVFPHEDNRNVPGAIPSSPIKIRYCHPDGEPGTAVYRWLGGIYLKDSHFRLYWNDCRPNDQGCNKLMMYDGKALQGLIVGGLDPTDPETKVPPGWAEKTDILFYERVEDSTDSLRKASSALVDFIAEATKMIPGERLSESGGSYPGSPLKPSDAPDMQLREQPQQKGGRGIKRKNEHEDDALHPENRENKRQQRPIAVSEEAASEEFFFGAEEYDDRMSEQESVGNITGQHQGARPDSRNRYGSPGYESEEDQRKFPPSRVKLNQPQIQPQFIPPPDRVKQFQDNDQPQTKAQFPLKPGRVKQFQDTDQLQTRSQFVLPPGRVRQFPVTDQAQIKSQFVPTPGRVRQSQDTDQPQTKSQFPLQPGRVRQSQDTDQPQTKSQFVLPPGRVRQSQDTDQPQTQSQFPLVPQGPRSQPSRYRRNVRKRSEDRESPQSGWVSMAPPPPRYDMRQRSRLLTTSPKDKLRQHKNKATKTTKLKQHNLTPIAESSSWLDPPISGAKTQKGRLTFEEMENDPEIQAVFEESKNYPLDPTISGAGAQQARPTFAQMENDPQVLAAFDEGKNYSIDPNVDPALSFATVLPPTSLTQSEYNRGGGGQPPPHHPPFTGFVASGTTIPQAATGGAAAPTPEQRMNALNEHFIDDYDISHLPVRPEDEQTLLRLIEESEARQLGSNIADDGGGLGFANPQPPVMGYEGAGTAAASRPTKDDDELERMVLYDDN